MSRVIFTNGDAADSDVWDDSSLILAYENAISETKRSKKRNIEWKVGDACRSRYSVDGLEYEAVIQCLDDIAGTCFVRYVGYDNKETVKIKDLLPSLGQAARNQQILKAQEEDEEEEEEEEGDHDRDEDDEDVNDDEEEEVWRVGDFCTAVYTEDGMWYEAIITDIKKDHCTVKFLGYDNVQKKNKLDDIYPSRGEEFRNHQIQKALPTIETGMQNLSFDPTNLPTWYKNGSIPPPPPSALDFSSNEIENEAFHSLLIAWYQAGFHSGYLACLRSQKKDS